MSGRTQVIIQGTAWGVQDTQGGRRFLRVSCTPGYRDRNGQWNDRPEQSYSVWPAGYAPRVMDVFDRISQLRQDPDVFVDVLVVGEVSGFNAYTNKQGQPAAGCTVNASGVCITNIRGRDGKPIQPGGFAGGQQPQQSPQQGYTQQPTDPWGGGYEPQI
ncbi:hypothetical protein DSM100688_0415 [Bifidobacterium ramosum]|uniref:Single-stranded DNA-binding protein n=1 Tax=Bifidobacterium ramosum TaxID=1798158 RepID=A0A6L4X317_9BIFI|nr:hypothetical protein [Bifidobacterium ramosum]KAB8289335.1 hypothetical protein DSM100688_0415 [Bifidobacterium ramosum]NEG71033.1 hypothetical protein [Bifidobacterium ramosum]